MTEGRVNYIRKSWRKILIFSNNYGNESYGFDEETISADQLPNIL
jgi:hypothetical protein